MLQKLVPDSFFILVNNSKQPLHAINSCKTKYFEAGLSKTFKNINFIFSSNPVSLNDKVIKNKSPGTSGLSLFRLRKKFTKISLFVIYHLTKFDGVIQSSFWIIPNITLTNLCKPIHDIINYSTFICPFVSGKWKGSEKFSKIWVSRERKELFRWIKKHFS